MTMYEMPSSVSPWSKISMMFGMRELLRGLGLAPKPLAHDRVAAQPGVHDLHGARAIDELVARPVDRRHAPFAEHLFDDVATAQRGAHARVLQMDQRLAVDEAECALVRVPEMALLASFHACLGSNLRAYPRTGQSIGARLCPPRFLWSLEMPVKDQSSRL